jgi:hypothetical protein
MRQRGSVGPLPHGPTLSCEPQAPAAYGSSPSDSEVKRTRIGVWVAARRCLRSAQVTGSLTEPQLSDVTVIIGERRLQLTSGEASRLHDLLVERSLALLALQSELSRALQVDSEQPDVLLADEEMRQELFLCLDASEAELPLTEGLRNLRQAARAPITPRPEL